jgi:NPCBM/NEW2 domain/Hypothetical glycosyl hydrolase family 15
LLLAVSAAPAQTSDPGHVNYQEMATPSLDQYTDSPSASMISWFDTHFFRMGVYSTYFDTRTSWYPNGLVYKDLYGIPVGSAMASENPQWILHDANGNYLYIPWGCSNGTCAQYAADITNPAFRAQWINAAGTMLYKGYKGLWIDDVNMEFNVSDGNGNLVAPIDSTTGAVMTWSAWRNYVAMFTKQIREDFPVAEISHNAIWYTSPNGGAPGTDPAIQQEIKAANVFNMERGIATDPNVTGGTGAYSVYAAMDFIDIVHSLGVAVTFEEYDVDATSEQYGLASYFMVSNGTDRIGDGTATPVNWWSGYSTDLGAALGPRVYSNGVFQRNFVNGIVLVGEPGLAAQTINLPAAFTTLEGQTVTSVSLTGSQGIILLGNGAAVPNNLNAAPATVTTYLSSLTPQYAFQSFGTLQDNLSVGGNPISLDGVKYAEGLGTHAYSDINYYMAGKCSKFTAVTGVDDEMPPGLGSLYFQVWADGWPLYSGPVLTSGSPAVPISLNVSGYQWLSLVVTNGIYMAQAWQVPCDHADWANAQLTCTK